MLPVFSSCPLQVVLKGEGDDKLDVAREMLLEGLARLPRIHKVCVGGVGWGVARRAAGWWCCGADRPVCWQCLRVRVSMVPGVCVSVCVCVCMWSCQDRSACRP